MEKKMITDMMKNWLKMELEGKVKKKDNPRKHSAYMRRIRTRIDHMKANLVWLAEYRPDILLDLDFELADESLPMHRRARALIKALTLFENEPTVLSLIAEIYSQHSIEVTKKQ